MKGWLWMRGGDPGGSLTPQRVRELSARLAEGRRTLLEFVGGMECEFLTLGERLREIQSIARQIQERSAFLLETSAATSSEAARHFQSGLALRAEILVNEGQTQQQDIFGFFISMRGQLQEVARRRVELLRALRPLGCTDTQFRVQAAGLERASRDQFFTLAEAIRSTVDQVRETVEGEFGALTCNGDHAAWGIEDLQRAASEYTHESGRLLAATGERLAALNQAFAASAEVATALSESGTQIASGLATAIIGLQCQDIVRQKVEHIAAAMEEMAVHLAPPGRCGPSDEADCWHFLGDASRLQMRHIGGVFEQLNQAGRQVVEGLQAVERQSGLLADAALATGKRALHGDDIQAAIGSLRALLDALSGASAGASGTLAAMNRLEGSFRDSTGKVLGLALALRRIALNAQIYAAHVPQGAALEVVAGATRGMADDAMLQLDEISTAVDGLRRRVTELEEGVRRYGERSASERRALELEVDSSEVRLLDLETSMREATLAVAGLQQGLAAGLEEAVAALRFPATLEIERVRALAPFEEIAADAVRSEDRLHHRAEALQRNYTMANEREVHAGVATAAPEAIPGASAPDEGANDEGGDIELF